MDQLKAANIVDLESSLPEFIKYSLSQIGVTSNFIPNYLVAVGSTKGLVAELCDAIKKAIGRDIPVISLPKVKYLNAGDAINWDEIRFQMKSQASPTNPGGINTLNIAKNNILNYIRRNVRGQAADPYATMDDLVKAIRNATSLEELESLISGKGRYISPDTEVKWKPQINGETMLPFIVRSSGRNAGGTRSFWKRKYNYDDSQFLEAAIDCVKSVHENPLKPKKMLIVDDNINTGQDTRDIRSNIEDVIKGIYESPTDRKRRAAEMQFGFYVLYDMKPALDLEYTIAGDPKKYNKFPVSSAEADAFATLKNLPPL
jgi:hypothetical protein